MKKNGKKARGGGTRKKKSAKKRPRRNVRTKVKAAVRKKTGKKKKRAAMRRKRIREVGYVVETVVGLEKERRVTSGLQSGDLQGLSSDEVADSESVDELVEEGNAFEAGVVAGVEESEDAGAREVRTRQVPVDDVPREYLDED